MLDSAECIADLDSTNESDKIYKVYNYEKDVTDQKGDVDADMKDDATTNASPDPINLA